MFHAFAIIRCLELRQIGFGCLLSWKRAGGFEIDSFKEGKIPNHEK